MSDPHIRRNFDDDLRAVHVAVVELGNGVADAIEVATRALLDRDLDAARRLVDGDDHFDAATLDIETRCYELLGLQGPMAGDLRAVITALALAWELERCGDLAPNIAKVARRLFDAEEPPKLRGMIGRMGQLAAAQLRFAVEAYDRTDEARAAALDDLDDEIDTLHRDFLEAIFDWQTTTGPDMRVGVQLALLGRFYERIGDHAVKVGERVMFQVTGWTPEMIGASRVRAVDQPVSALRSDAVPPTVDRGVVVSGAAEQRRTDALRRDFVANIGHELRTPVGALVVLAETLQIEVEELGVADQAATVGRLAQRLTHEATRLGHTVDDLLELSRIEAGEPLIQNAVAASELADAAVERTWSAAELAGVRVEIDVPAGDVPVHGDRRQLVSALTNLIDNAIKYSERDGTVTVRVEVGDRHVAFIVRDHGIGIPGADQVKIFERFHRVDRARRRDTGGTGLGLSIVRHVALNHHGTIEVDSVEGEGATFTLSIPSASVAAARRDDG
ncbi:MAG: phosphate signaling complex protein PhoU [Actinobacteria bacterium]|nr:phosphate signaling complex protein PhoU [Actinomycetota bacterium]